jgi:hypothetical protein
VLQQSSTGLYLRADGSYRIINLPALAIGLKNVGVAPGLLDDGAVQRFTPSQVGGAGFDGGIGYILPGGIAPLFLGANARVELDGDFTHADVDSTQSRAGPDFGATPVLLNGTTANNGPICNVAGSGASCPTTSALRARYSAWRLDAKAASDFAFGTATVTPTIGLTGGHTDTAEDLAQNMDQNFGGVLTPSVLTYNANLDIKSFDVGGKLGLGATVPITGMIAFGAHANVAAVYRHAALSGSDAFTDFFTAPAAGTIADHASSGAVLTDLGADVDVTPMSGLLLRAFVGFTDDSAVAGISAPRFSGPAVAATGTTPAAIVFSNQTGWYIGAGGVVRF